ncbi:MAG TPA: glycosyltransferase family 4 protein [Mycobacteriales bacterium]|nr:glycosyltransferase family 4 protein [Mycobacteriales bacterium]
MRIGLVCPYTWDVPGGVQSHVRDLAEALIAMGHRVSVLTPVSEEARLPPYAVSAGRAVPVPYNGSVARLQFGPVAATRVRRWLRDGRFDVLHVHEPVAPSVSLLACMLARGPIVATFHTSNPRSRSLSAAHGMLQPFLERIHGRIAVSAAARQVQVEHLGGDAVEIPNGVAVEHYAGARPLPGYPRPGGTVGFVGRYDEPRKGMAVLLDAMARLDPQVRLLVAGPGDARGLLDRLPPGLADRIDLLGQVDETDKARMLASVDVYCAPNTGGESFGVILLEAMATGTAIAASDLESFRRVLTPSGGGPRAGELFRTGDGAACAAVLQRLLGDSLLRRQLVVAGRSVVAEYDWHLVAAQILRVYELVAATTPGTVTTTELPQADYD